MLQVWKYASAMAHLGDCLEVAAGAAAEKRRHSLAISYDEICRREWHMKALRGSSCARRLRALTCHLRMGAGDRGFSVNVASLTRDPALLDRARLTFDKQLESEKGWSLLPYRVW